MYSKGDIVNTRQAVSRRGADILKKNKIKPGQQGIVVNEETLVTVNFDGQILVLNDNDIEFTESDNPFDKDDINVDRLMGMFGMKK
jgi:hypothetical protein